MRLWLAAVLGFLALRAPSDQATFQPLPGAYPSITNETFIKWVVDAHNKYRSEVRPSASNMLYMSWDIALARTARAWANKCIFEHSPYTGSHPDPKFRPIGENLWISNAVRRPFKAEGAIKAWNSEVRSYNFQNNKCTRVCGHYTQVVWDVSYKVGCAIVFCYRFGTTRNIENFVCNYGPGGNYPRRPYRKGRPCSECPKGDTCVNKLCSKYKTKFSYTRWYPSFEYRIVCDESCIALAILRPSLMFLAFGVVYYLQHRYPGLGLQQ
ncbi:glioma pathogenesis-related protein 1-like [Eublepharis macularius]|uniref:Glioma pathogenesis-related protein 1-like n=1 Tax=Eublepharis macularius TaxID=481883 RepID=A0AA97L684_EUBMA|nr:glioma pathogenesis-related protein 1-like [Eublepharis macularius]